MEEFEKERIKNELQKSLEYIEEKTAFEKSMGEAKHSLKFSDGFADDLVNIMSKTDEDVKKEEQEYQERLTKTIIENVEKNKELIVSSDSYILEDFVQEDGIINMEAVFQILASDICKTFEEFQKSQYWDMYQNSLNGWLDIFVIDQETNKRTLAFTLSSKNNREEIWKSDLWISLKIVRDKLLGIKGALSGLFGNEDKKDLSWKEEIWKNTYHFDDLNKPCTELFKRFDNDFDKIFEYYQKILQDFKEKLEVNKFSYKDEEEWDNDMERIDREINTETTVDTIYRETFGELWCIPQKHNTISASDIANAMRKWLMKNYNIQDVKIKKATKEQRDASSKAFFDMLDARMPEKYKEKETTRIMPDTQEYYEKYGIPKYGGNYY